MTVKLDGINAFVQPLCNIIGGQKWTVVIAGGCQPFSGESIPPFALKPMLNKVVYDTFFSSCDANKSGSV